MNQIDELKQQLLWVTTELVSECPYCICISDDPQLRAPISCTKYSGSKNPILVNVSACLACQEYKKQ
ncbi:hypothetical protein [Paenibacillus silviterrae]|uniref:hypothetical protein n=1 Tax=Paenibacillus silviterrae TaxID=3242194 RepID=UPI0025432219|nr:hypothetical protein [Paenibacillus chinjuensis]